MNALSLSLFGQFQANINGQTIPGFRTRKVQALLIYLATEPQPHRRESLLELLWPGMPERSARQNLRQISYNLRQNIPEVMAKTPQDSDNGSIHSPHPTFVPLLITNRQTIQINPQADVGVDVNQYLELQLEVKNHKHVDLLTCHQCRKDLEQAAKLYSGGFLSDFYLDDSNTFETWVASRRQALQRQMLDILETLTTIYTRQKQFPTARTYGERQLEIDDLRESGYRQLMEILALDGQRAEALILYERCQHLLRTELGMAPTSHTTEIYNQIVAGDLRFDAPQTQGVRGYDLKEEIGSGAYGTIYRAIQPTIRRDVAVKVIRRKYANDPTFIRRFEAEAQTIARLEHPYIVPLYDYWRDPEGAYLVMRLLRGGNLLTSITQSPWNVDDTVKLLEQITSALAAAHRQGIVHRDIKPANILFDESGNAFLSDFGIAKDVSSDFQLTGRAGILGTPDYSSPEQLRNEPVTPQADLYSLGAVLYGMLAGKRPFADDPLAIRIQKHLQDPFPLISITRPDLPAQIDTVIQQATAKRPSDRYPDALAMAAAFRRAAYGEKSTPIAMPTPVLSDVEVAVAAHVEISNPYKGLRAFQESDAADFYGRESLVQQLLSHLSTSRFLAVVGPSGSGKSSLVKAGLIPALRQEALPGSDKWFVSEMVPGTHPLEELELALLPIAVDPPPSLLEPLQKDERGLLRTMRRILPAEEGAELLLVIDQFEELFTLVEDDGRRQHFLNNLLTALNASHSPLRVVVTLRADFYDRPLQIQAIADLFKQHTEIVLPLSQAELTEVIQEPARQMGVGLEAGVITAMVTDVADQPGALPLLQYALTELFAERQDNMMTLAAYHTLGGVSGALAQRAEEIYTGSTVEEQEATRQLFLRLVTLGEGVEDTRRRVRMSELEQLGSSSMSLNDGYALENRQSKVANRYGRYRLLTFDHDPLTREPTVEVAHEALLREWPRLRNWLEQSRDDVRLQRLLTAAAAEWSQSGKDAGFLLRGSRLDLFADWAQSMDLALTPEEQIYLAASLSARGEREAKEQARQQRELETAQQLAQEQSQRATEQARSARRLRWLAGGLAIILLIALGAAYLAVDRGQEAATNANLAATREAEALNEANKRATAQAFADEQRDAALAAEAEAVAERQIADEQRQAADEQATISFSRELASAALTTLDSDPELGILLAMAGLSKWHTIEAENALHRAIFSSSLRRRFFNENNGSSFLSASPNGEMLYVSGAGGGAAWDTTTGDRLFIRHVAEGDWINSTDISPDGSLLVLSHESYDENDQNLPGEVTLADAQTGETIVNFTAHDAWVQAARFNQDGSRLATTGADMTVNVWDVESTLTTGTGQLEATYCCLDDWDSGLAFRPDSNDLAITMGQGNVVVWDFFTDESRLLLGPQIWGRSDYSPDGKYLVTAGQFGNIEVWDADTGEQLSMTRTYATNPINLIQFNRDGTHLVSPGIDGSVILWAFSPEGLEEIKRLPTHEGGVAGAGFSPDSRFLYTTSSDGLTSIWDISPTGQAEIVAARLETNAPLREFELINDGSQMVIVGFDGVMRLWDMEPLTEIKSLQVYDNRLNDVAVSPNGQMIATASLDEASAKIWDAQTWELLFTLEGHDLVDGALNPGIFSVQFNPNGRNLATAGRDNTIRIWAADTGDLLQTLTGHASGVTQLQYSPDGKLIASASGNGVIKIWDAVNGQLLLNLINDGRETDYWGLAFSPDGRRLAAGGDTQLIEMWQLPENPWQANDDEVQQLFRLQSDAGWIDQISFSPDGDRIAVPGWSDVLEIRDAYNGELLLGLQQLAGISQATFSDDGKRLMTVDFDGVFRIWALDFDELTALAQSRVTRILTEEECQRYLHVETCPDQ